MNAVRQMGTHFVLTPDDFRNMPSGSFAAFTALTGVVSAVASVFLLMSDRSSVREKAVLPLIYSVITFSLSSTALLISPKAGDVVCLTALLGCMVLILGKGFADSIARG